MVEPSVAQLFLAAARRDEQAFRALAKLPDMNDAVIGFHAQQCVEKSPKAALSYSGIAFRYTQDIAELLDFPQDAGHALPPDSYRLDELKPYAVEARYALIEPAAIDREAGAQTVASTVAWSSGSLAKPSN